MKWLACSVVLSALLSPYAFAQENPTDPAPVTAPAPTVDLSTPEKTALSLVEATFRGDFQSAVRCVVGGTYAGDVLKLETMMKKSLPSNIHFSLEMPQVTVNGNTASLSARIKCDDPRFAPPSPDVNIDLVRDGDEWKIKPFTEEEFKKAGAQNNAVRMLATMLRYPKLVLGPAEQEFSPQEQVSLTNVKQIVLGCLMYCQDYDEKFAFVAANYKKAIFPYVKNEKVFTSPLDKPGTVSYKFNQKVANRTLSEIPNPVLTVMLYEGEWGKPSFRNDGKAVIGFVDGHCKLVNPSEAGKLIWSVPAPKSAKPAKPGAKRRKS